MSALETQVGGSHYKTQAIQPIEFSMANNLDACAHSILKYVTRHNGKAGRLDLEKVLHFIELRRELHDYVPRMVFWAIPPADYWNKNELPVHECSAVHALCCWLETDDDKHADYLVAIVHEIIKRDYDSTEN